MEIFTAQILLEKSQLEALTQIAEEESRSLSEVVREMINRELRSNYNTDPGLTEFAALDNDDFLFEDNEKG